MKYLNCLEGEIKNKVAIDYFWLYDCTRQIGNIDFCVCEYAPHKPVEETHSFLWAEAKKGGSDIYLSMVQLILTVGKAKIFNSFLPPAYFGAFDAEKIAFLPYNEIQEVFYLNDFNWNVTPSNHQSKEFKLLYDKVCQVLDLKTFIFRFLHDDREIKSFIKKNFVYQSFGTTKITIDKNNFITIYNKWLKSVKPTIAAHWDLAKKHGIIDGDFYLADLLSQENYTLKEKLFVLLRKDHYELDRRIDDIGMFSSRSTFFTDGQKAHTQFWNKYERPPREEYWEYIVERRDLLVPQDIRERKGSFFTPQAWVELSQQYFAEILGKDWQDEYYVWDCAAGTGNLLTGLTNKYQIWASTLDKQDVDIMHDRIQNGANLLSDHVFQFDFLNDDFKPQSQGGKLPDNLYKILNDPKKRKKVLIYINPPYAEAGSAKAIVGTGQRKPGVTTEHKAYKEFRPKIGNAANELYALFLCQVYEKIPDCHIAFFSTLKFIQGTNFRQFKEFFKAKYLGGFIVPANTFDNVKGKFPIGFTIWDTTQKEPIQQVTCDIYEKKKEKLGTKTFYGDLPNSINQWIKQYDYKNHLKHNGNGLIIGYLSNPSPDYQQNNYLYISLHKGVEHVNFFAFHSGNLIPGCIYFAVRHCMESTWMNDRDQFLFPNEAWLSDNEFQNDCFVFTLFHHRNRVSCVEGLNHWIPFSEQEVDAKAKFDSNFMKQFIMGTYRPNGNGTLYEDESIRTVPLVFSQEAQEVLRVGLNLWKYYHQQPNIQVNASFYDIRLYFQGKNEKGIMNSKSSDNTYNSLMEQLREAMSYLAEKVASRLFVYRFLRR